MKTQTTRWRGSCGSRPFRLESVPRAIRGECGLLQGGLRRDARHRNVSATFDIAAPELRTPRLVLRRLSVDDATAVFAYARDTEVARFTLWSTHTSVAFTRTFLEELCRPYLLSWAIIPVDAPWPVGMVFLHTYSRRHMKAEIAFNLGRQSWGKGFATEASTAVVRYAFADLGLNRIEATCMPENTGSLRVLEKLGMTREGTMRLSHWRHDGFHDMVLCSVLRDQHGA